MEGYLNLLIEQFKQARGIKNGDINSRSFINDFSEWLKSRQAMGATYLDLLDYMGLSQVPYPETKEIGKGMFDTVVKPLNTTIITPYTIGLEELGAERLVPAGFAVQDGIPFLTSGEKRKQVLSREPLTFMTQNPYTSSRIRNWEQLHNSGACKIIIGMFGRISDNDSKTKIELLMKIRELLRGPYSEEQAEVNGSYYYVIASQAKVKRLVKTR